MILGVLALLVITSSRSWAAPPREGYVPVEGGLRLHYREIGQGKDTVIIPSDVGWGTRADGLAQGRTVVLYDPRGHGRSDEIKDPSLVGMDYEVRDIEALRRHLSLKRVSLVGWSYMGALVALYAAQYPERVDAVVQVGPMPLRKGPHFEAYIKNTQARRDPAADERLAQMQKDGLPERDPVAYCKAFYEAAARTMVARPDVTGILPPGLCDLANERPTGRPFSVTGRLFESLGDGTLPHRPARCGRASSPCTGPETASLSSRRGTGWRPSRTRACSCSKSRAICPSPSSRRSSLAPSTPS